MHAKISFAAPLTGEQAIVGIPMRQCAELAVEEASKANDLPGSVELWAADDLASPSQSREVARRLFDDPSVVGVVGHKNSGPSGVAAPIYAEAGLTPDHTFIDLPRAKPTAAATPLSFDCVLPTAHRAGWQLDMPSAAWEQDG